MASLTLLLLRQVTNSNPYGLGDGVNYYLLETEIWDKPHRAKHLANGPSTQPETSDSPTE
jgi:hypothetical protein